MSTKFELAQRIVESGNTPQGYLALVRDCLTDHGDILDQILELSKPSRVVVDEQARDEQLAQQLLDAMVVGECYNATDLRKLIGLDNKIKPAELLAPAISGGQVTKIDTGEKYYGNPIYHYMRIAAVDEEDKK